MPKRDHSAISKKAWRTRKRMKATRNKLKDQIAADIASGLISPGPYSLNDPGVQRQLRMFADKLREYRRVLPCPNFNERLR
jgi:hypothetical protein